MAWNSKQTCDTQNKDKERAVCTQTFELSECSFGPCERFAWDPARNYNIILHDDTTTIEMAVPVPCYGPSGSPVAFRLAHLPPTDCIRLDFTGIHNTGYYIGVNKIILLGPSREVIPWVCTETSSPDGTAAFPGTGSHIAGWWTPVGTQHHLILQLFGPCKVHSLQMMCANTTATPKILRVTNGVEPITSTDWSPECFFQLHGPAVKSIDHLTFDSDDFKGYSCTQLIAHQNINPTKSQHGIKSLHESRPRN